MVPSGVSIKEGLPNLRIVLAGGQAKSLAGYLAGDAVIQLDRIGDATGRSWPIEEDEARLESFKTCLARAGYQHPRFKLLPSLKIGQEALRDHGYSQHDYVTRSMILGYDTSQLMCSNSRIVSTRGVHVCPILVDQPESLLGNRLSDAKPVFVLKYQACMTCYQYGALCSNASSAAAGLEKWDQHGSD